MDEHAEAVVKKMEEDALAKINKRLTSDGSEGLNRYERNLVEIGITAGIREGIEYVIRLRKLEEMG